MNNFSGFTGPNLDLILKNIINPAAESKIFGGGGRQRRITLVIQDKNYPPMMGTTVDAVKGVCMSEKFWEKVLGQGQAAERKKSNSNLCQLRHK